MKKKLVPILVLSSTLLVACNKEENTATTSTSPAAPAPATTSAPAVDKADAVAVVNGQYIPKSALTSLEKEVASHGQGQSFPKDKLIDELVQREVLIQDATKKHLDQSPEVNQQLENTKKTLLAQADLLDYLKKNPVTEAELKAEYDKKIGSQKGMEYKARHILVKTEDEAKKVIDELAKGADFAKLANKVSLDAKDSQNGGELGWFNPAQMVPPFSKAVAELKKGETTKTPVQTQFGWHVIQNEDSRSQTPPPLEAVKEQLTAMLQRQKVQTMLKTLVSEAKVEKLVAPETAKPAAEETAKPAVEPAKAGSETAAKPAAEEAAKPAAEPAKAGSEAAAKPAAEETAKPAAEPAKATPEAAAKPAAEETAKPAAKPAAEEPAKPAPAAPGEKNK